MEPEYRESMGGFGEYDLMKRADFRAFKRTILDSLQ